jgi:hypothetical protein
MFWKRSDKGENSPKLQGPRDIPETVKKYVSSAQMIDPGMLPFLKAVVKNREKVDKVSDIYIFDPSEAEARQLQVKNYDTIKENPDMIIAEGWFNDAEKKAELTPRKAIPQIKLFTYEEILQQIKDLKEPGSSVFFYANAGTGAGGPLGRGAKIVKLNVPVEGKKTKKYGVYGASVIDMQPTKRDEGKIFDVDKPEEAAKYVAQSLKPRFC